MSTQSASLQHALHSLRCGTSYNTTEFKNEYTPVCKKKTSFVSPLTATSTNIGAHKECISTHMNHYYRVMW